MQIVYKEEKDISEDDLLSLYSDAGWSVYTRDLPKLKEAIKNSYCVLTARDESTLVGLIRVISDGLTIAYIQDILVLTAHKRKKIGTELMNRALERFKSLRQIVLLTDESEEQTKFYESLGFKRNSDLNLISYVKINK